jgi:hypothetical protein
MSLGFTAFDWVSAFKWVSLGSNDFIDKTNEQGNFHVQVCRFCEAHRQERVFFKVSISTIFLICC